MAKLPVEITTEVTGGAEVDKLADDLDRVGDSATKTGSITTGVFQGIGQKIAEVGIGLAKAGIDLAIDAVGQSIELASNKAESASKVNVLFGESADIVTEASKDAATSVGLSSGAYLESAGNLGNLITNLGFTGDEAANMSVEMLQLASDMGSFNNASTEEVTEAMGAAFRGETEPIRRFGVMLDEAAVKAKAVEMGLYDGVGAIDKNAKAQATYKLILEQTTSAQGDFARTSDGLANSQRIAGAKIEEALTKVGEVIMPLAAEIVPKLADAITGVIDVVLLVAEGFGDFMESLRPIGDAINAVSDAFDFLTGKVELSNAQLHTAHLQFIDIASAAGLAGEDIETAWVDIQTAIAEGRIRSDADVKAFIQGQKDAAAAADEWKTKFTEMATQAGWSGDMIEQTWTDIVAATNDGRIHSQADVDAIIANHAEMALSAQREAEITEAAARASTAAGGDMAAAYGKINGTLQATGQINADIMQRMVTDTKTKMSEMATVAKNSAVAVSSNIVDAIKGTPDKIDAIMDDLMYAINHPLELQKNIARINAELVSKNLQDGLKSKDFFIRTAAEQTQQHLHDLWTDLTGIAWDEAHDTSGNLKDGYADAYPQIKSDANQLYDTLQGIFAQRIVIPAPKLPNFFVGGGGDGKKPKNPSNGKTEKRAAGGPVRGGEGYIVGEDGPEWFVPGRTGYIIPHGNPGASSAVGRAVNYVVNVTAGVGDPVEIGRSVRRALDAFERAAGTV